jgi:hypothetical protein
MPFALFRKAFSSHPCWNLRSSIKIIISDPRPTGSMRFRCKAFAKDFKVTSGTLFASHKLPLKTYLSAVAVFCNEVKG